MKLLLDTHIFLWGYLDPSRIVPRVASELESPENELWLSPISTWETILLAHHGRIVLRDDPIAWVRRALVRFPFREAPLTHEVSLRSRLVTLSHEDPADRFLAATASVYELTLVTSDARLLDGSGYSVLANQ